MNRALESLPSKWETWVELQASAFGQVWAFGKEGGKGGIDKSIEDLSVCCKQNKNK